jgi:hypothetical protein
MNSNYPDLSKPVRLFFLTSPFWVAAIIILLSLLGINLMH